MTKQQSKAELQQTKAVFQAYWLEKAKNPTKREAFYAGCPIINYCPECKVIWPNNECYGRAGLVRQYDTVIEAGNLTLASTIARQIAELPWRE